MRTKNTTNHLNRVIRTNCSSVSSLYRDPLRYFFHDQDFILLYFDVNQLIQNTEIDRLVVSSEPGTLKKYSNTVFYLTKFNIPFIP
jgi:hypothetical protein